MTITPFHQNTGSNVHCTRLAARRKNRTDPYNTTVFSDQPIPPGDTFTVQIKDALSNVRFSPVHFFKYNLVFVSLNVPEQYDAIAILLNILKNLISCKGIMLYALNSLGLRLGLPVITRQY